MTELPIERKFQDAQGVDIYFYEFPVANPRGVVQIAHGLGDHGRRYDDVAAALNRAGFSVYADDHRGHGKTGVNQVATKATKTMGNLGPGGMPATFEQVHDFTKMIKAENPGLPLVLIGHSWGSFIAQKLLNNYSGDYAAAVLTGSTLLDPRFLGMGAFNKKWAGQPDATGFEWLSRDAAVADAFLADPFTFYADAAKVLGIGNALKLFFKPAASVRSDLPLLIMAGSDDPIGGEKGNRALAEAYLKRSGVQDLKCVIYQGARHEVFNETNKEEVVSELLGFIERVLGA